MKNRIISIIFSALCIIGIIICVICDLVISKTLTWSLITISSITFAWIISFPIISFGSKGISKGIVLLSISIIPFLYILSILINENYIFKIGSIISFISIMYIWCIFGIFQLLKTRKYKAIGITFLLMIPFELIINIVLSMMIFEPIIDIWDILSSFILLILGSIFFILDTLHRVSNNKNNMNNLFYK